MMKTTVFCSLLLLSCPAFAAVYECKDAAGNTVYSQDRNLASCRSSKLAPMSSYQPRKTAPQKSTTPAESTSESQIQSDHSSIRRELAQAERDLEEGKKVRYGNERNYVRYQERIQALEDRVNELKAKAAASEQ